MCVTKNLARYIRDNQINIRIISKATGITVERLEVCLADSKTGDERRALKDYEFIKVCSFLEMNPMYFQNSPDKD